MNASRIAAALCIAATIPLSSPARAGDAELEKPPVQGWRVASQVGASLAGRTLLSVASFAVGDAIWPGKTSCTGYYYSFCTYEATTATATLTVLGQAVGNVGGAWAVGQIGDQSTSLGATTLGAIGGNLAAIPLVIVSTNTDSDGVEVISAVGAIALMTGGATAGAVWGRRYDEPESSAQARRLQLAPPSLSVTPTRDGYQTSVGLSGRFR